MKLAIVFLSLAILSSAACTQPAADRPVAPVSDAGNDAKVDGGVQQQIIQVGSEFTPSSVRVRRGTPVRLIFNRGTEPSCADQVVFPKLNITRKLPANSQTVVEFTPAEAGELAFACGMNMMKGSIVVQ